MMQKATNTPLIVYKLMIVAATLIWGSSFVVMKDTLDSWPPSWLIGVRFTLTSFVLGIVFWKRLKQSISRDALIAGGILGIFIFAAYWFQTVGLVYTTPGKNAFLTATYCVIVPFIYWFTAKRRPTVFNIVAAFLCIAGVGFVSLANEALTLGFGDAMTLVCGVLFAAHIVAAAAFAKKHDILVLTIYQFFVGGLLGILVGAISEPVPQFGEMGIESVLNMAYLIIFCSCVAMGFQNVALAYVPPSQVAILLSLESVFGVVFSVILYGEALSGGLVVGFVLIFASIILSEVFPRSKPPKEIDQAIAQDSASIE